MYPWPDPLPSAENTPGDAFATGTGTTFEAAPPDCTWTATGVFGRFDGTTATICVAVMEIAGTIVPPIVSCASLPKPAPRTTIVSPADSGPSSRLAAFTILST